MEIATMEPNGCRRCGGPLPQSSALVGACPRCMLELGLEPESAGGIFESLDGTSVHPVAIARYRILRLIGEGGMGSVYEAEQDFPRRIVAIKIVKPGKASPELLRRFELESEALGRLQHPGIAQIYEAGTADTGLGPQPYFAMEYIRGKKLTNYAEEHHLNMRQRMELMARISEAVHHAHQRGLIHRDLKPANILIDESGQPKIVDFGVARTTDCDMQATTQTDMGQLVGTLAYMSPEQVLADPLELDTRSDVYSLGVILYELMAGRLPYPIGRNIHENLEAIREIDPVKLGALNPSCRGDIETIVGKALEKDKTIRYASANALAIDIHRYLKDEPIAARPPSASYQLRKFARRNKALVTGIAAVFVVLVAGIVATTSYAVKARRLTDVTVRQSKDLGLLLDRAYQDERTARTAEAAAKSAKEQTDIALTNADRATATANELKLLAIAESLAIQSVQISAAQVDDDRAALLARQAMLLQTRVPNRPHSLAIEDAIQQAARPATWNHNILPVYENNVFTVAISRDGAFIASGGIYGKIRVWDVRTPGTPPIELWTPSGFVYSLAFSSDGKYLVTGGVGDVRLWDLRNRGAPPVLFENPTPSHSVAISPDGTHLAAGGIDGSVRVWPLGASAADYLCTRVWRNLSMEEWRLYVGDGIPYERTCPGLPPGEGAPRMPKGGPH